MLLESTPGGKDESLVQEELVPGAEPSGHTGFSGPFCSEPVPAALTAAFWGPPPALPGPSSWPALRSELASPSPAGTGDRAEPAAAAHLAPAPQGLRKEMVNGGPFQHPLPRDKTPWPPPPALTTGIMPLGFFPSDFSEVC